MSNTGVTLVKEDPLKVERALLVGMQMPGVKPEEAEELLDELGDLTRTLGIDIADRVMVRVREPRPRYLLGEGKARELIALAQDCRADVLIFDDPLTPSQQRNWEELSEVAVIDRQEVILDIFGEHARTREATLQVSLARANYTLPRLKRRWTHLHRQRGAAGGQGMRGEGEQQLEMDSRMVRDRITKLKRQLEEVQQQRDVQRSRRLQKPVPVAAIVGYTNAGKSSLLNALTDSDVLVEDQLFATLDSTVRRITLPNQQELLLADTVGFIRKLPHLLVEAFKSTLEETRTAEFLIEVIDATSHEIEDHRKTTREVLHEIGTGHKPIITVINKIDLLGDALRLRRLKRKYPDALFTSVMTGEGLDEVVDTLSRELDQALRLRELFVPHNRYDVVARLHRTSAVLDEEFDADGVRVRARIPRDMLPTVSEFVVADP